MTLAPDFSAQDFATDFLSHMPLGAVWPRDSSQLPALTALILAQPYARNAASAAGLLVDAFPATTDQLLPEWEETLGLPDPCAGPSPTLQQRQAQVLARFIDNGGASVEYFIAYAAALGFSITISQFAPSSAGSLRAGKPANGEAWAFAWQVNAPSTAVTVFRAGMSAAGEPLQAFGNAVLQCEIERLAPAHTTVTFAYGASAPVA